MNKIITLLTLVLIVSCQPSKDGQVDLKALKDEVFDIHDEVMPKMGDLRRVRKSLMLQADSIQLTDSLRAKTLLEASNRLATANEGMMQWMRDFNPDFEGSYEEELKYLNEQKEGITKVRDDMLSSLADGEKILEEN